MRLSLPLYRASMSGLIPPVVRFASRSPERWPANCGGVLQHVADIQL